ncbi:uracil-DNA glycosylase family protein [Gilvimarinus sp. 1_MG-2023]|uniref:uracil-DNA glycosylase family protein n=1 Tax=Gilvimarinus sp. 1_MG-2023 TaxID=3062638 RepID=UPI0026E2DEAD|nr:uracil-DNA glycosylase family protein [Gilvimarinus sp. 1_MG-2023]MDO6746117.1 uracil-DNA glycosylase family protein [Gilvimarinus sp. 1_MG-2023]
MNDDNLIASHCETLLHRVRQCTECAEHLPFPPRPILQASSRSRILIAAQAPGKLAHDSGLAFNDPSGDRLRRWLGVDSTTFYNSNNFALLPMGFCFPGAGKSGDLAPRPECAPLWRQPLLDHLSHIRLTLVIGQYAQAWHLPNSGKSVTERVQQWHVLWPDILPLPHPSGRNNRWLKRNPWFEQEVVPMLQERIKTLLSV